MNNKIKTAVFPVEYTQKETLTVTAVEMPVSKATDSQELPDCVGPAGKAQLPNSECIRKRWDALQSESVLCTLSASLCLRREKALCLGEASPEWVRGSCIPPASAHSLVPRSLWPAIWHGMKVKCWPTAGIFTRVTCCTCAYV